MPAPADLDRRAALGLMGGAAVIAAAPKVAAPYHPDRELRVPARGGKLYVRVNGTGLGKRAPVLFIHGGPGSSHWYFLPALALADDRAVIRYDQLDSGRSDAPGNPANWTVERFVSEIDAVRAALTLDRLHIVGKSWGGTLALEYAARRPAGLLSLVLAAPLVLTRSWEASTRQRLTELPQGVADAIRRHERDGTTTADEYQAAIAVWSAAFDRRRAVPPAIAAYRDAMPRAFSPQLYGTMWGAGETAASGTLHRYDGEPLLPRIAVPVLFLTGEYDELLPSAAALLARRVPIAETRVVPGAGHSAVLDNPEAWVGAVRAWTARWD